MGGLSSTVTNDSIFRTLFLTKISCHVPENPKVPQAHGESLLSYINFIRFSDWCFRGLNFQRTKGLMDFFITFEVGYIFAFESGK